VVLQNKKAQEYLCRGLGDRYNSTTMNGLPIPSNDPEKKNLNLEIFSGHC
jgi:hypothetical protein